MPPSRTSRPTTTAGPAPGNSAQSRTRRGLAIGTQNEKPKPDREQPNSRVLATPSALADVLNRASIRAVQPDVVKLDMSLLPNYGDAILGSVADAVATSRTT